MTIRIPKILLPNKDIDLSKWAVVACDQFTSQREYWQELDKLVGGSKSCLRMVFPEAYLEDSDKEERTATINATMQEYLSQGVFEEIEGFVLVDRVQSDGKHRIGLMLSVDLEDYDYTPSNNARIKATEKTVVERLPARIAVRQNASIEIPHIMLLMDDRDKDILGKLYSQRDQMPKLYDFDLNMKGGRLTGYKVPDSESVLAEIMSLLDKQVLIDKYQSDRELLFVVGDGNHSLATAKECWRNIKENLSEQERQNHPARYALCELVSLQDSALEFQPIHRVLFGGGKYMIEYLQSVVQGSDQTKMVYDGKEYVLNISTSPSDAIADIQNAIDEYIKDHPNVGIDYVHGDEYTLKVAEQNHAIALFMPTISKDSLFGYVARRGVLPRKSFSMGHAEDKRYYMESKKIK